LAVGLRHIFAGLLGDLLAHVLCGLDWDLLAGGHLLSGDRGLAPLDR